MINNNILSLLRLIGHQGWIRLGLRERIMRYFVHPDKVENFEFVTNFYGYRYKGNLNRYIDWMVYFYGAFNIGELYLFRDLLIDKPDPIFIDVGANVGHHSLFMSKYCSEIHSFEPYEEVRNRLLEKISLNNINNIVVHNVALGALNEYRQFYAPTGANQGQGSFISTHAKDSNVAIGKLQLVKGDDYIEQIGLIKIDLIKIDVEGFEKYVLIGFKNTLELYRPIIFMECTKTTVSTLSSSWELMELLPKGYKIVEVNFNNKVLFFFNREQYVIKKVEADNYGENMLLVPN